MTEYICISLLSLWHCAIPVPCISFGILQNLWYMYACGTGTVQLCIVRENPMIMFAGSDLVHACVAVSIRKSGLNKFYLCALACYILCVCYGLAASRGSPCTAVQSDRIHFWQFL